MRITKQASCPGPSVRSGGGGGGSVTGNESFVTVNNDSATLPNSRQLTGGALISVADGGAGSPITVNYTGPANNYVQQSDCIGAAHFVPAQSPYSPAPIENYYIAANGFSGKVVRYDPGVETAATCFWTNRWVVHPWAASFTVNFQINFFTDNASSDNFSFELWTKSGGAPSTRIDTALSPLLPEIVPGTGAYRMNRVTIQFNTNGDVYQFMVRRLGAGPDDINPGTAYMHSVLMYYNVALES